MGCFKIGFEEKLCISIKELTDIMSELRGEDGCPWDREQTADSLKAYILEEAYEVVEAIDDDETSLKDELGDLLLQVVFQARIAEEENKFNLAEVVENLNDKLVRRHPHVFADSKAENAQEVRRIWQDVKKKEKQNDKNEGTKSTSALAGYNKGQSALMQAYILQEKAAEVGFDWDDIEPVIAKIEEELAELKEAVAAANHASAAAELGDLIFAAVNLSRFIDVNPELAVLGTNMRFIQRFNHIEETLEDRGEDILKMDLEALDELWEEAKLKNEEMN
ncbi:MAG: nucleoside triphosphate pyrophosphohydrolase [Bacillota bacterium]